MMFMQWGQCRGHVEGCQRQSPAAAAFAHSDIRQHHQNWVAQKNKQQLVRLPRCASDRSSRGSARHLPAAAAAAPRPHWQSCLGRCCSAETHCGHGGGRGGRGTQRPPWRRGCWSSAPRRRWWPCRFLKADCRGGGAPAQSSAASRPPAEFLELHSTACSAVRFRPVRRAASPHIMCSWQAAMGSRHRSSCYTCISGRLRAACAPTRMATRQRMHAFSPGTQRTCGHHCLWSNRCSLHSACMRRVMAPGRTARHASAGQAQRSSHAAR